MSEPVRSRRSRTQPPPPNRRGLPGRAEGVARASGRVVERLAVPGAILDMVRYGSEHPDRVCGHWWRTVEDRTEQWVLGRLSAGASRLRIQLDPKSLEVVLAYSPPGRACG